MKQLVDRVMRSWPVRAWQRVLEMRTDCDQDVVLLMVEQTGRGAACHTGRKSCFYRALEDGALKDSGEPRLFDPRTVYGA